MQVEPAPDAAADVAPVVEPMEEQHVDRMLPVEQVVAEVEEEVQVRPVAPRQVQRDDAEVPREPRKRRRREEERRAGVGDVEEAVGQREVVPDARSARPEEVDARVQRVERDLLERLRAAESHRDSVAPVEPEVARQDAEVDYVEELLVPLRQQLRDVDEEEQPRLLEHEQPRAAADRVQVGQPAAAGRYPVRLRLAAPAPRPPAPPV